MRRFASLCCALGLLTALAGIGTAIYPLLSSYSAKRPLFQAPILLGESAYSPWLRSSAPAMRVGLGVTIAPRFVAQELQPQGDGDQVGLYRFPLHYRVRDEDGNMLIDQWVLLDASENRILTQNYSELEAPDSITLDAVFDSFPIPKNQRVRVEALLLPDRLYSAEIVQAELRTFRQPPAAIALIRHGIAAIFAGVLLILLGLLTEIRAAARLAATTVRPATPAWAFPAPARPQPVAETPLQQAL